MDFVPKKAGRLQSMNITAAPGSISPDDKPRAAASFIQSVRGRLFLLLIIVLVPVVLVQILIYRDRLNTRRDSELRSNMEVARTTAKAFEDFIQYIIIQERGIAFSLTSFHALESDVTQPFLDEMDRLYPDLEHISIISADGRIIASSYRALIDKEVAEVPDFEFHRYQRLPGNSESE